MNTLRKLVISCGAVPYRVTQNGAEVLLIKQFQNREIWGFPKGHLNFGETFEQCAIREVREETGITVNLLDKLSSVTTTYGDEEKVVHSWLAMQSCNSIPNASDPDCEIAEVRWWKIFSLPNVHLYQRSLFNEVVEILRNKRA